MDQISFNDFQKLDIRIGKILSADKVAGTDKLVRLEVEIGNETRELVAGIGEIYDPDNIVGKEIPVLVNLAPKEIKGIKSRGMILVALVKDKPVLLHPDKNVPTGSKVM